MEATAKKPRHHRPLTQISKPMIPILLVGKRPVLKTARSAFVWNPNGHYQLLSCNIGKCDGNEA